MFILFDKSIFLETFSKGKKYSKWFIYKPVLIDYCVTPTW